MAEFGENEEDNILKEDMNNLNELGLMRDSNEPSGYDNLSDKVNKKYNKTVFNLSANMHNKIAEDLANDSQEEIDQRVCEEARILYVAMTRAKEKEWADFRKELLTSIGRSLL